MGDCIDAQIIDNLITVVKSITSENEYNTNVKKVELARTQLEINDNYPYVLVIPNETDPLQDYGIREDVLPFLIWYFDGKNDTSDDTDPFTWRLRNVAADFIKALRKDPSLGGVCENIRIVSHNYGIFVDDVIVEPGVFIYIEIERVVNPDNPYEF